MAEMYSEAVEEESPNAQLEQDHAERTSAVEKISQSKVNRIVGLILIGTFPRLTLDTLELSTLTETDLESEKPSDEKTNTVNT